MTAFLLTWKESGWPHSNIVRMSRAAAELGYVDEPWRLAAHKQAKSGDRVWVLKQGRGPKGIFGKGRITGKPEQGPAGNGKVQWMAPVRFEAFVDPKEAFLIGEDVVSKILRASQIAAPASGYPLDDSQSNAFETASTQPPVDAAGLGDWTPAELKRIVADYSSMLRKELAHEAYSKTEHRRALMQSVHRTEGSIERKHQNISAVLMTLGLPWIDGYKPLGNFQDALLDTVEAAIDTGALPPNAPAAPVPDDIDLSKVVVPPPETAGPGPSGQSIRRLLRKFDPAARDAANRSLGEAGEEFVRRYEIKRLIALGKSELAAKVVWVSKTVGDGLGYDIESFAEDGSKIFIEVKTTRGPIGTPFFISPNELRASADREGAYRLYRVFSFGKNTRLYPLSGSLHGQLELEPVNYRASVAGKAVVPAEPSFSDSQDFVGGAAQVEPAL